MKSVRRFMCMLAGILCLLTILHTNRSTGNPIIDVAPDDSTWHGDTLIVTTTENILMDPITGDSIPLAWFADIYQVYDTSRIVSYTVGDIVLHSEDGSIQQAMRWEAFPDKKYLFESDYVPVYYQENEYLDTVKTVSFTVAPGDTITYYIEPRFHISQPPDGPLFPDNFSFRTEVMCSVTDTLVVALDTLYINSSANLSDFAEALASRYSKWDSLPDPMMIGTWVVEQATIPASKSVYIRVMPEFYGSFENEGMLVRYYTDACVNRIIPDEDEWPLDSICARIERGDSTFMLWALDSTFVQNLLSLPKSNLNQTARSELRKGIELRVIPTLLETSGVIELNIPYDGSINVYITDLQGRELMAADLGYCKSGKNYVRLRADGLSPGLCIVWAIFDNKVIKASNFIVIH